MPGHQLMPSAAPECQPGAWFGRPAANRTAGHGSPCGGASCSPIDAIGRSSLRVRARVGDHLPHDRRPEPRRQAGPRHPRGRLRDPPLAGEPGRVPQASGRAVRRGIAAPDHRAAGAADGTRRARDDRYRRRPGRARPPAARGDRSGAGVGDGGRAVAAEHGSGDRPGRLPGTGTAWSGQPPLGLPFRSYHADARGAVRRRRGRPAGRRGGLAGHLRHHADQAGDRVRLDRIRRRRARSTRRTAGPLLHREATARPCRIDAGVRRASPGTAACS